MKDETLAIIHTISRVITFIFILEALAKIIVYGFIINGPNSYLLDGWNIFDFLVVISAIFSEIFDITQEYKNDKDLTSQIPNGLKILKTIRIMRSLRILSRNEGLKHCVLGLIYSFPGIMNVTFVVLVQLMLMSIFFVQIFSGKYQSCKFPSYEFE